VARASFHSTPTSVRSASSQPPTERREQLTTELERLVEAPDDLRPDLARAGEGTS
jgi:hypothetical protein